MLPDPFLPALVNDRSHLRLKHSSDVAFFPCGVNSSRLQVRGFVYNVCYFAPVTRHSFQAMSTVFSSKDFFRLFEGLLRLSTRSLFRDTNNSIREFFRELFRTFVRIQKVIWDQLLASKAEII